MSCYQVCPPRRTNDESDWPITVGLLFQFVQTLARALQNLNSLETSVDPYLAQIGRLHVKFVPNGFDPSYWNVFETAIQAAMRKHVEMRTQLDEKTKIMAIEAWVLLAHYIIDRMRDGFDAAIKDEKSDKGRKNSRLFPLAKNAFQRSNSTSWWPTQRLAVLS